MVLDWGMSDLLGHVALGGDHEQVFLGQELTQRRQYSETTAREVDEEIRRILDEAYNKARQILQDYRQGLDRVAQVLLEKEDIPGSKVIALLGLEQAEKAEEQAESEKQVQESGIEASHS
jgi:cell division protease FtsH